MRHLRLSLLIAVGLGFVACDEEEPFFRECPFSNAIIEKCEEQASTDFTCVVLSHPMCDEGVCATWEDSGSFCSRECKVDDDCPNASTCESYLETGVCVPDVLPPANF